MKKNDELGKVRVEDVIYIQIDVPSTGTIFQSGSIIHNTKNYGIMGLSYCPGNVCVVSDHRIKTKSMVWKLMLHEFCHAFYGAKHCPNDDPKCFMKDAKGKGNVEVQNWLCDSCKR